MTVRKNRDAMVSTGNYVAEWFGHRVWPQVDASAEAVRNQSACLCPFLSTATASKTACVKTARDMDDPTGVCVISSDSNGDRQDWLACPVRTLDSEFTLLVAAIRTTYCIAQKERVVVLPVTVLHLPDKRAEIQRALAKEVRVFAFAGNKVGGEVDIPETEVSPGGKVDVSVIEITGLGASGAEPDRFGKHMFYEIQTADFHGSPLHAVRRLRGLCPTRPSSGYHDELKRKIDVAGEGVEGPNKANIFKRTVYQLIIKIQLTEHPDCAGFVLVLPVPVWESWLRHLGKPELVQAETAEGPHARLVSPADRKNQVLEPRRAWIFVFDIDRNSKESPQPLLVTLRVATTSAALVHYTFQEAAEQAMAQGVVERFRSVLKSRVSEGWRGRRPGQGAK